MKVQLITSSEASNDKIEAILELEGITTWSRFSPSEIAKVTREEADIVLMDTLVSWDCMEHLRNCDHAPILVVQTSSMAGAMHIRNRRGINWLLGEDALALLPTRLRHLLPPRGRERCLSPLSRDSQGHILIANSEDTMRVFEFEVLYELGYDITICSDLDELLACYERSWWSVDVVLMQGKIAGASAPDAVCELMKINPTVRAIIFTVAVDPELEEHLSSSILSMELPYSIHRLRQTINGLLADGGRQSRPAGSDFFHERSSSPTIKLQKAITAS